MVTFNRLKEILEDAARIHNSLKSRIDFTKEDKKHAIYIIQGGILVAANSAYKFNLERYYVPTSQQKRLIDEALDLIWFFDENEEKDQERQLKAWFKGHIVEREPGNSGNLTLEQRAIANFMKEESVEQVQKLQRDLNNLVSKVMHPTIAAMRSNMTKHSHDFDYENTFPKEPGYNEQNFGEMFVIPALNSMRMSVRYLPLSEMEFNKVRGYINEIMESHI